MGPVRSSPTMRLKQSVPVSAVQEGQRCAWCVYLMVLGQRVHRHRGQEWAHADCLASYRDSAPSPRKGSRRPWWTADTPRTAAKPKSKPIKAVQRSTPKRTPRGQGSLW